MQHATTPCREQHHCMLNVCNGGRRHEGGPFPFNLGRTKNTYQLFTFFSSTTTLFYNHALCQKSIQCGHHYDPRVAGLSVQKVTTFNEIFFFSI